MYTEKYTVLGKDYIAINIYKERPVPCGRKPKTKPTSDAQKKLNKRESENRLRNIVHNNFREGDLLVRLDYNVYIDHHGGCNPDEEFVKKEIKNYIKRLRKEYRKRNIDLKYIYNYEIGTKMGKPHHHLFLNMPDDKKMASELRNLIEEKWQNGYCNTQKLRFGENGIVGISNYIAKQRKKYKNTWCGSNNIVRPSEENGLIVRSHNSLKDKDAEYIDSNPDDVKYIKKLYPGWNVGSVRVTAIADQEEAEPCGVPLKNDPDNNVRNGIHYPDFGGRFIELFLYSDNAEFLKKRENRGKYYDKQAEYYLDHNNNGAKNIQIDKKIIKLRKEKSKCPTK